MKIENNSGPFQETLFEQFCALRPLMPTNCTSSTQSIFSASDPFLVSEEVDPSCHLQVAGVMLKNLITWISFRARQFFSGNPWPSTWSPQDTPSMTLVEHKKFANIWLILVVILFTLVLLAELYYKLTFR